jgi:hypothetical protein
MLGFITIAIALGIKILSVEIVIAVLTQEKVEGCTGLDRTEVKIIANLDRFIYPGSSEFSMPS